MSIVLDGTDGITTPSVTYEGDATINGLTVGRGAGAVSTNTAVGASALNSITTGDTSTGVGFQALQSSQGGSSNTAIGVQAMRLNTSGASSLAAGRGALYANTSGSYNVACGQDSLAQNTTASYNTAVGYQAGFSNTTGAANQLFGYRAGYALTTGGANTFVGSGSGNVITTGNNNSILGNYTGNQGGLDIRTASNYIVLSDGDGNPWYHIQGSNGQHKLRYKNANLFRVAFTQSYFGYGTDYGCLVIGQTSSTQTVSIGYDPSINTDANFSGLGGETIFRRGMAFITPNFQNTAFFTQFSMTDGVTSGDFNDTSDVALKENIQSISSGWNTVRQLRPVTFDWKQEGRGSRSGFIAQEVEALLPNDVLGEDYVAPDQAKGIEGTAGKSINTTGIVAHLTKALQEAMIRIEQLESDVATLKGN